MTNQIILVIAKPNQKLKSVYLLIATLKPNLYHALVTLVAGRLTKIGNSNNLPYTNMFGSLQEQ